MAAWGLPCAGWPSTTCNWAYFNRKSHRGDLHPGIGMIQCHNDQRDETTLDRSGFILLHLTNIHGGIPP